MMRARGTFSVGGLPQVSSDCQECEQDSEDDPNIDLAH
jgi:hypothetical protein